MKKFLQLLTGIFALVTGAAGLSAQMTPADIEITQVKGDVEVIDLLGGQRDLRPGSKISTGIEVRTPGKAQMKLVFANGTRLVVESGTTMRVSKTNLTRNGSTRESGFTLLSTHKEPSFSTTEIIVVQGSVLLEIPPLNLPVSSFVVTTDYHRALIQEPRDPANRRLLSKPVVMRFEQGIDYGRLSVFKGVAHSVPNYPELGPQVDITEGDSVTYRFKSVATREPVKESPSVAEALTDPPAGEFSIDPSSPKPWIPLFPEYPGGPIDLSLIYLRAKAPDTITPPARPPTANGQP